MADMNMKQFGRKSVRVAIDASRNRSGGARAHLIGILENLDPEDFEISEVHVWSYPRLIEELPERPWLFKHEPKLLKKNVLIQLWWQLFRFPVELRNLECDVLLSTGASTVCLYTPSIVMSRDMLSFEPGEMQRYPFFSKMRFRLWLIKHIQIAALRRAEAVLFLTDYASRKIQEFSGRLKDVRTIPHGVGERFRVDLAVSKGESTSRGIQCVYISNADLYKHQAQVIRAFYLLHQRGGDQHLTLVGDRKGPAEREVQIAMAEDSSSHAFISFVDNVEHHRIVDQLVKADIFVFASSCENMPNTLLEAMAAGRAIACSERGPMPEVLKDGGIYFDPESPASIADAIERLSGDLELRISLARRAQELALEYSWIRCARETFGYLVDVAQRARSLKR